MDKKQEIIAIISGDKKIYYKAAELFTKDTARQGPSAREVIPEGKIKEYYADLCTEKTYRGGRLINTKTLKSKNAKNIKAVTDFKNTSSIPAREGKTFIRTINKREFFINGKKTGVIQLDENGEVISRKGEMMNGTAKEYYPNGSLKSEACFKQGLPEGEVKIYDNQGRIVVKEYYSRGLNEGKSLRYNYTSKGYRKEEMFFSHGRLEGIRKILNENDKIRLYEEYKGGVLNGITKIFNEEGSLEIQTPYRHGKKHGKRIFYYPDGNIMHEENYVSGLLEGERKTFFKNGNPLCLESYTNNYLNGLRIVYDNEGKIQLKELYQNGKLIKREER